MRVLITRTLEAFVFPPGLFLLLLLAAVLLWRRRPGVARWLVVAAAGGLYLAATPLVAQGLVDLTQRYPARPPQAYLGSGAGAIVVLGGGRRYGAREYGGDTVSEFTLERLRFAARLQRVSGLPVLVSGGDPFGTGTSEASLMAQTLRRDFAVPVRWLEAHSRTTRENALDSARILHAAGIRRVLLVTHAWHMPRALTSFQAAGLDAVPAPTAAEQLIRGAPGWFAILPGSEALEVTRRMLHEWVGRVWYAVRRG